MIAIDGPAGSGKSTTAKFIARHLGWKFLDTGAYYRAATQYCIAQEVPLDDEVSVYWAIYQLVSETEGGFGLNVSLDPDAGHVEVGSVDVTEAIRTPELTEKVHYISGNLKARQLIVKLQQDVVQKYADDGIVLEGRDVTDVVAPSAKVRVILTASEEARAARRSGETNEHIDEVASAIRARDLRDSKVNNFTKPADDGIYDLDNSALSIEETASAILKYGEISGH